MKRINENTINTIISDILSNQYNQKEIAIRNGVGATTVARIMRSRMSIAPREYTRYDEGSVVSDIKNGKLFDEIIAEYGMNSSTLYRIAKRNGVDIHKERKPKKKKQKIAREKKRRHVIPIEKYNAIVSDLRSRSTTQSDIAKKYGVAVGSVWHITRELGLSPGKGIRFIWNYDGMTKELAYLIGAYLTDGHIQMSRESGNAKCFMLNACDKDFVLEVKRCLDSLGKNASVYEYPQKNKKHRDQYRVQFCSMQFCSWLLDICGGKEKTKIPECILTSEDKYKIAFIAACIDGDGCVDKMGTVSVTGTCEWMHMLKDLINSIGARSSFNIYHYEDHKKQDVFSVSVHRTDYVSVGGYCSIARKQNRLLNASRKNPAEAYSF